MTDKIFNYLKNFCYACGACSIECNTGAITLEQNSDGFFVCQIDDIKCIDCGKCLQVCPILNTEFSRKNPMRGYAYIGGDKLRDNSSSGGAFGAIAEGVIIKGGYVCGAAFSDDYRYVKHIIIDNVRELSNIQKSKYVQSRTEEIYRSIKNILETGKEVFFCGTPCQVAGLKSYLRLKYENLLTADLLCHAANSELAWQEFILDKGKITEADFRDKTKYYPFSLKLQIGGTEIFEPQSECDFMQGFYAGIFCRDSCDRCPFPYYNRVGDITLADFWGVENVLQDIDYKKGCSAILVNNEKGQKAVDKYLKNTAKFIKEVDANDIISRNGAAEHCFHNHPGRRTFFENLKAVGFKESYDRAYGKKYDFGLVGFWYTMNYGAALTAFALANVVKALGYSVLMIEAPGIYFADDNVVYEKNSTVRKFISQYFQISERQASPYQMQSLNDVCEAFLVGSDQLWGWQPGKYHDGGAYYLLDFVNGIKKKVAYGTSFGKTEFSGDTEDVNAFGFHLRRFSDVSVREQDAVSLCNDCFGVAATWVVDPVFLLSEYEYEIAAKRSPIKSKVEGEKYIFVYMLQPTKQKNEIIRQVMSRLGMKVVAVSDLDTRYGEVYQCDEWEFEHYTKLEVADWLKLIQGAEFVLTDSYHGFCFSLIFRKQFLALTPRGGLNRFNTIAGIIGLEGRIDIGGSNEPDYERLADIDYIQVWEKLQPEITRSRKWLEKALNRDYKPSETDALYDVMRYESLRLREDCERKIQIAKEQYFSMSCKLRRQSYITRRYIVRDYLIKRLDGKMVAIRGAGGHTDEILRILSNSPINIMCIWDERTKDGIYGGHPVVSNASVFKMNPVDVVLISSWKYREEMMNDVLAELAKYDLREIEVIDFYSELQQKGIPIDSEYFWFDWDFDV